MHVCMYVHECMCLYIRFGLWNWCVWKLVCHTFGKLQVYTVYLFVRVDVCTYACMYVYGLRSECFWELVCHRFGKLSAFGSLSVIDMENCRYVCMCMYVCMYVYGLWSECV